MDEPNPRSMLTTVVRIIYLIISIGLIAFLVKLVRP
jgi:hypothetical protein